MDAQLRNPKKALLEKLQSFVCLRIVDMATVDLEKFRFDYDLTFAMTVHYPNGRPMSCFGGRNKEGPAIWLKPKAIDSWLARCLKTHRAKVGLKDAFKAVTKKTIWDVPAFSNRMNGRKPACIHCHNIGPALRRDKIRKKTWKPQLKYVYPDPSRVGLVMDPLEQNRVLKVKKESPADRAGLKARDVILSAQEHQVLSISDFQQVLHSLSSGATTLELRINREDESKTFKLPLPADWRTCSPQAYAWRPMKWELAPAPGFGGKILSPSEKKGQSVPLDSFGLRIDYIVNWGHRAAIGKNVLSAGLRKGDIILSIDGKSDFESADHFHSWVRLACRVGQDLDIVLLRNRRVLTKHLVLLGD